MSLIRQFAIRNELLYSGFVLPNVQIFFVQKISFATFGVSIDDFFTRYAGLGYSLLGQNNKKKTPVFRVTRPYLNLLVKPSICIRLTVKYIILCFLKGKKHKIIFFPEKSNIKICVPSLPSLKVSDLLPETHLFFICLPEVIWGTAMLRFAGPNTCSNCFSC